MYYIMLFSRLQSRFLNFSKILPQQMYEPNKTRKIGHNNIGQMTISYSKGWTNIMLDRLALILTIVGALNWGSIGLFRFDIVAWIFGGQDALLSRIIYTVVALAGIWCISLLFRERESEDTVGEIR